MAVLKEGGIFIIKIYDSYYDITCQLLKLLCIYFEEVSIIKPLTSRPANSERYVTCKNYLTMARDKLKKLFDLLDSWVQYEPNVKYLNNQNFVDQIIKFKFDEENNEFK